MTLIEQIKADQLSARKLGSSKIEINLLTSLYADALAKENRETKDVEVVATVKTYMDNAKEIMLATVPDTDAFNNAEKEMEILTRYLPKQLSLDEIRQHIIEYVNGLPAETKPALGDIMSFLKKNYGGKYDGSAASTIAKEVITNKSC